MCIYPYRHSQGYDIGQYIIVERMHFKNTLRTKINEPTVTKFKKLDDNGEVTQHGAQRNFTQTNKLITS